MKGRLPPSADAQAISKLMQVRRGARCNIAPPPTTVAAEVGGVINFVSQLREGVPPKDSDIAAFSDAFLLVLKLCEDLHIVQVVSNEPGVLLFTKKLLRGAIRSRTHSTRCRGWWLARRTKSPCRSCGRCGHSLGFCHLPTSDW